VWSPGGPQGSLLDLCGWRLSVSSSGAGLKLSSDPAVSDHEIEQ
jgi:hypothetical protein